MEQVFHPHQHVARRSMSPLSCPDILELFTKTQIILRHVVNIPRIFLSYEHFLPFTGYGFQWQNCPFQTCSTDGQWTEWHEWLQCSYSCNTGTKRRYRVCSGQSNGGEDCPGKNMETALCNMQPCRGEMSALGQCMRDSIYLHELGHAMLQSSLGLLLISAST